MKRFILIPVLVLFSQFHVGNVQAAVQRVQVAEFTVSGAENARELKTALKNLLSSRIASDYVLVVDNAEGVVARITGSYSSFENTFSIDATVSGASGEQLGRRYVQGEGQKDLIPAIGKLAEQLRALIPASAVDVVRVVPASSAVAQLTRIEGILTGIAPGRTLQGKDREYVVADATRIYLYRQTESLKKVAEYALKTDGKILTVDTADVDNDGTLEVYVTVVDREELVSVALAVTEQGFTPIADKLPFFFRAVGTFGQSRRLFAQNAGRGADDFYGEVCRVVKNGAKYSLGEPVKLPKHASIFSFNFFSDNKGKLLTSYIDKDRVLHIADETGKDLWKSADRFGGSEMYFLRDEQQIQNMSLDRYRWRFLEQRIVISPDAELLVPQNSGTLSVGNHRAYSKNSVIAFVWNGASLEERWHTMKSPDYLADFFFDAAHRELVMLEQAQKESLFSKGASVIITKKIK